MDQKFSGQLDIYMRQAGLPLRRLAKESGIPHQTIFNWVKGTQPRWYAGLPGDLERLGSTLGLNDDEITLLLRLARCMPSQPGLLEIQEVPMESSYHIPKGWFVCGGAPEKYEIGLDPMVTNNDQLCVTIKAGPEPVEFAALAQTINADAYRGKRLQFTASTRAEGIKNMAALFMRVNNPEGKILAFDNMRNRPITGSSDWESHAIVLDVTEDAEEIMFGFLLSLEGKIWMSGVSLKEVGKDVPTTDLLADIARYFPVNLDFTE